MKKYKNNAVENKKVFSKKIHNCFWNMLLISGMISTVSASGEAAVNSTLSEIAGVLTTVGILIAVIKLLQIGIQFLVGGATGKNQAKTAVFPWLVGLFICATYKLIGPWVMGLIMGGSGGGVFDI